MTKIKKNKKDIILKVINITIKQKKLERYILKIKEMNEYSTYIVMKIMNITKNRDSKNNRYNNKTKKQKRYILKIMCSKFD